jgi:hypothetical protein
MPMMRSFAFAPTASARKISSSSSRWARFNAA